MVVDWYVFVEWFSVVENLLCSDLVGIYVVMDFVICDYYCYVIEYLVWCSGCFELEVVCSVFVLVYCVVVVEVVFGIEVYVGYYLVDEGCVEFEWVL